MDEISKVFIANRGTLGNVFITVLGVSSGWVEAFAVWVKLLGGIVGIIVGILTIIKLVDDVIIKKNRK